MASATSSSPFSSLCTNSNDIGDDSFSSYLALIRQSISTDLANSIPNPNPRRSSLQINTAQKITNDDEEEIDVFSAEKYFSGSPDVRDYSDTILSKNDKKSKKKKSSEKSLSASTCSETSANSQSILLPSCQHQQQPSSVPHRRRFLDVLWCYCSKKNSVMVEDEADNHCNNRSIKLPTHFGREIESSRSLTALGSESSSELFEIDSRLSTNNSQYPLYEPSEESIEWSVTTASAANLSVAAEIKASEGKKWRSSGLLLGCVSDKAVSVMKTEKVSSVERDHVVMDLDSTRAAGAMVARTRRTLIG